MKFLIFVPAFLVAISILVAVHEFGHYWVAKKLGFKVLRFSIGFGKPLITRVGRDADRTEYCLAAIPLGGYVKLLDEREGDVAAAELHRSFTRRPILHRVAVLLAGPAMNLVFASLLYAILAMVGSESVKPVVGHVFPGSAAAVAGLQNGDQIVRVGERNVEDTEELQIALIRQFTDDGVVPLHVRRDGAERHDAVGFRGSAALTEPGKLRRAGPPDDLGGRYHGTEAPAGSAGARRVARRRPAAAVTAVYRQRERFHFDGERCAGPHHFDRGNAGPSACESGAGPTGDRSCKVVGRLGISLMEGQQRWPAGLVEKHRSGPLDAVVSGVAKTWEMSALTVQMLWRMLTGQVSAKNISGVVSIAEFAGISAYLGVTAYLAFLAIISVSLGVLNLMPVPLLDGGQIVYQVVEAIKGSPISERAQLFGQQVGIALLVVLMSLAFYNDISRHLN